MQRAAAGHSDQLNIFKEKLAHGVLLNKVID